MAAGSVNYMCSWVEHSSYFFSRITALRHSDLLTDVTITCGDKAFKAHRLVLCASSEYFRKILVNNIEKSAYVHIMGVSPIYIQNILQYLYTGQIEIAPSDVEPFLKVANELKICGLSKEESATTPDYNLDLTLMQNQANNHDAPKTEPPVLPGEAPRDGEGAFMPSSILVPPPLVPPLPPNIISPFQPTEDQEPEEASEQITIVPDIVDMSDNYENIKEDSKENICSSETMESCENNDPEAKNKFTLSLNALAVDPANNSKRKSLNDVDNFEKRSKLDTPKTPANILSRSSALTPSALTTSPTTNISWSTTSPHMSPLSAFPGLTPVNCRKGHSGQYCKHTILPLPDGKRVHFNKQDYERWLHKNQALNTADS